MAIRSKSTTKRSAAVKKVVRKPTAAKRSAAKKTTTKHSAASKPKSNKLHHRAQHHIKKHLLRYVGGATALFLLTFMTQSGFGEAAAGKPTPAPKKGYMIIFSQNGRYSEAIISSSGYGSGAQNAKRKCSGVNFNINGVAPIKLAKSGKKISCDAVGGSGQYTVAYTGGRSVAVDIDAGYCTYVHEDASQIRKVPVVKGGGCQKAQQDELIVRDAGVMNVNASATNNKKGITGFSDIRAKSFTVNRTTCSGQVKMQLKDVTGKVVKTKAVPAKFVNDKKNPPYCVSKYSFGSLKPGLYTVTANYAGSKYFNPISATSPGVLLAEKTPISTTAPAAPPAATPRP